MTRKTLRSQRNASKTQKDRLAKLVLRKLLQYQKQFMSATHETSTLSKLERILKFSQKQKNFQIDKAILLTKKCAVGITIPNLKENKTSRTVDASAERVQSTRTEWSTQNKLCPPQPVNFDEVVNKLC